MVFGEYLRGMDDNPKDIRGVLCVERQLEMPPHCLNELDTE